MPSLGLSTIATLYLALAALGAKSPADPEAKWMKPAVEQVTTGIRKVRFGTSGRFTPGAIREAGLRTEELKRLPPPGALPFEPGQIHCWVGTKAERSPTWVGIDDSASKARGGARLKVFADGRELWNSGLIRGCDEARRIVVDIRGAWLLHAPS